MKQKLLALAAMAIASNMAFADLPTGVTTAISGGGADAVTALGAIIVVLAGIWALKIVKRLF